MRKTILAGLLASVLLTGTATATAAPAPTLPPPTGRHPVGATTVELVDAARADPWVPASGARRLMVSLWYPAAVARGPRAAYMTSQESALLLKAEGVTTVPPGTLSRIRTDAHVGASPAAGRHPLVVLSPGFSLPRSTLTSLGLDLASRGYVVAAIDHTYENFGETFPDGRTTTCAACAQDATPALARKVAAGRAADVSFVLDRLTGPRPAWRGGVSSSRIGMAGHSIGGDSTAATMAADPRVRAGVNMDGTFNTPVTGLSRPFLLLGTARTHTPSSTTDGSWAAAWPRLTGWKRWMTVAGTQHSSFTDLHPLADRLGVDFGADISGARATQITRAYVGAFFDRHLRHRPEPLLDGPSPRYPEVTSWS